MVLCPSDHGADVLIYDSNKVWAKTRYGICLHEDFGRLDLYKVTDGVVEAIPFAVMENMRTVLTARRGHFSQLYAWHAAASTSDAANATFGKLTDGTGSNGRTKKKSSRRKIVQQNLTEGTGINMYMVIEGRRNGKVNLETWNANFRLSDPRYSMVVDNQGNSQGTQAIRAVRIYFENVLVCTGRVQSFDFLNDGRSERPFVGIQVLPPKTSSAPSHQHGMELPAFDVLPLLLVLCWADDVYRAPVKWRAHFLERMRNDSVRSVETTTTDIGWDPLPVVSVHSESQGARGETVEAKAGEFQYPVPPPPASPLSSHRVHKTAAANAINPAISVKGI
eukprot:TRINITY_DN68452_c0_g1_i1.p1 TRINITY_DN68452_c0_g1~~TRINITY_DN68452_c0_g1_i1.p1  ORF type:complete len:394 (+),score=31.70 TRINITY_DN68452_c0_g1_i1:178-1182(+)